MDENNPRFIFDPDHRDTIVSIETNHSVLQIPKEVEGRDVQVLSLSRDLVLPTVETLILPASIYNVRLSCRTFPNLRRVEVDKKNRYFLTDGQMLYKKESYREQKNCLAHILARGQDRHFIIPTEVDTILKGAFLDAPCEIIEWEKWEPTESEDMVWEGYSGNRIEVKKGAFEGSKWLKRDGCLYRGSCFAYLAKKRDTLLLKEGTDSLYGNAFNHHAPAILEAYTCPRVIEDMISSIEHPAFFDGLSKVKKFVLLNGKAKINWFEFSSSFEGLEAVVIPKDHPLYKSEDGVVYSTDGKILHFYPAEKADHVFHIPEGVENVGPESGFSNEHLETLYMPSTIKTGFFTESPRLKVVIFSAGVKKLATSFWDIRLTQCTLPPDVEMIESYLFRDCIFPYLDLPPTLKLIGENAFRDVHEVRAYEGTAKNLWNCIYESHDFSWEVQPHLCRMIKKNGKEELLLLPRCEDIDPMELHLAWDGDTFDYGFYLRNYRLADTAEEKMICALLGLYYLDPMSTKPLESFLRAKKTVLGQLLIDLGHMEWFTMYLEKGFASSPSVREKLLSYCNSKQKTQEAALLLEVGRKTGEKKAPSGRKYSL